MISDKAMKDHQAISLAEAVAVANEAAKNAGVFDRPVRLVIEEKEEGGTSLWRINYIPVSPPGVFQRGGDYLVEVNAAEGTIYRTLYGQ